MRPTDVYLTIEMAMPIFLKIIKWISEKMKAIGAVCLVGMTFLTCADVVGRRLGHPIFGSVELVGYMAILAAAMALPYTHKVKGHIGVEILVRIFSERVQTIIDTCTSILSFLLFGIVTWRMVVYAYTIKESGEVSMNLEFPIHLIIFTVSLCLFIFTIVILQDILNNLKKLKENR